jgi:hypothetical protein
MLSSRRGDTRTARVCLVAVKCCVSQCIIAANEARSHGNTVVVRNVSFLLRKTSHEKTKTHVSLIIKNKSLSHHHRLRLRSLASFQLSLSSSIIKGQISHTNATTLLLGTFLLFQCRSADWQLAVYIYACMYVCMYLYT